MGNENDGLQAVKAALTSPLSMLLVAVALGAVGQILLKVGMDTVSDSASAVGKLIQAFQCGKVITGFLCYGVSSLLWLLVIQRVDLSYAYPMIALSYVAVVFLSWKFLGEHVPGLRLGGLALIAIGVVLVGIAKPK